MKRLVVRTGLAVLAAALMLATSAAAALAGQGYAAGGVAGESAGGGGGGGTLPFTGADLVSFAVVGLVVLLSGVFLRRYTARRSN